MPNHTGNVCVSGVYVEGQLHDTITKQSRFYVWFLVRGAFFGGVLEIVQAEQIDAYAVEEMTLADAEVMAAWRVFAVAKCDVTDRDGLYEVRIPGRLNATGKPSCQCYGYNRHQHCKHIDSLADLVRRNQI